jgi:tetratricopeptide (TPR) repeat protein
MRPTRALAAAACAAALALAADVPMSALARSFPPLSELPRTPLIFQDVAFASAGLRAAGADLAWVQMLQYAADGLDVFPGDSGYDHIKELSQRVTRLDPSFHRAYLYAAGILGWFHGVDRPNEALDILLEARRLDPGQKLYGLYIAGLAYKKKGDSERMVALLDSAYDDPQTSSIMRTILANIHQERGEYDKALAIWEDILEHDRDKTEHGRARVQIPKLEKLIRERASKRQ